MTKTPTPPTASGQIDSVYKTIAKDKAKKVYLPRVCQLCEASFSPTSARALRCHKCNPNSSQPDDMQPDDMQMETVSIEPTNPLPNNENYLSIINNLENKIRHLQEENNSLRIVNTELKIRLADNIVALPMQKSYAQALSGAQTSLPKRTNNAILLESSTTNGTKLTNVEVNAVRQKIENALNGDEIRINAISFRPTHTGKIVVNVENETDKQLAVTQINQVAAQTGYTARSIPKKLPRLIIKNIPIDYLPSDLPAKILHEYPEISNLITTNTQQCDGKQQVIKTIVVLKNEARQLASVVIEVSADIYSILKRYGKIRLGMCVYAIADDVRIAQC